MISERSENQLRYHAKMVITGMLVVSGTTGFLEPIQRRFTNRTL